MPDDVTLDVIYAALTEATAERRIQYFATQNELQGISRRLDTLNGTVARHELRIAAVEQRPLPLPKEVLDLIDVVKDAQATYRFGGRLWKALLVLLPIAAVFGLYVWGQKLLGLP